MTPALSRYRLPRRNRLQRQREFDGVRAQGTRAVRGCLIANWLPLAAGTECRLGVVLSLKVGPAVFRSRARRLLREAFRRHQHEFRSPVALILVARPSIAGKPFAFVERDLLRLLGEARLLAESTPTVVGAS